MKKRILSLCLAASTILLVGCSSSPDSVPTNSNSSKKELTRLTLNEVAHSIFYAPMYVAMEKGYFLQEGIDLRLHTGFGADKTMTLYCPARQISALWAQKLPFILTTKGLLILL